MVASKTVLIFRPGSFGDHIISLPCLHLVARCFPESSRILLTTSPYHQKAPSAESLLGASPLIHQILEYSASGLWYAPRMVGLVRGIRKSGAKTLVYLSPQTDRHSTLRDLVFFWICGIRRFIGLSGSSAASYSLLPSGLFESEASRLTRSISTLGDAQLDSVGSWSLNLSNSERLSAFERIGELRAMPILGLSISSSMQSKDWGTPRWEALMPLLRQEFPSHAVLFFGAQQDRAASEAVFQKWKGPGRNLCGVTTPRESSALLGSCDLFLGADSGPMHVAASCNVPCIALFSMRTKPGIWFPYGTIHEILYRETSCANCGLLVCIEEQRRCLAGIEPADVIAAARRIQARTASPAGLRILTEA